MSEIESTPTPELELFHQLIGEYIAAKTYRDYSGGLVSLINKTLLKSKDKTPKKGIKSFLQITQQNELSSKKHVESIEGLMKSLYGIEGEVEQFISMVECSIHDFVTLSPSGQRRVQTLIDKMKREDAELNYWKEMEASL